MAYNHKLSDRIREELVHLPGLEEKKMMGGIVFMYREKMLVGVMGDSVLCRVDPDQYEELLEKNGCRTMEFAGQAMKGWVLVEEEALKNRSDFSYWIGLALEFNPRAKKSKK